MTPGKKLGVVEMVLYVKAKDIDFGDEVWLRLDGNDVEAYELDEFEPDPFSQVTNIAEGKIIKVGIYEYKVIGGEAYTRGRVVRE